jgi:hypothetical protein
MAGFTRAKSRLTTCVVEELELVAMKAVSVAGVEMKRRG